MIMPLDSALLFGKTFNFIYFYVRPFYFLLFYNIKLTVDGNLSLSVVSTYVLIFCLLTVFIIFRLPYSIELLYYSLFYLNLYQCVQFQVITCQPETQCDINFAHGATFSRYHPPMSRERNLNINPPGRFTHVERMYVHVLRTHVYCTSDVESQRDFDVAQNFHVCQPDSVRGFFVVGVTCVANFRILEQLVICVNISSRIKEEKKNPINLLLAFYIGCLQIVSQNLLMIFACDLLYGTILLV